MKKKILGLAMIAVSLMAFSSQAQQPSTQNCTNKDNCKNTENICKRAKTALFQGINLSDAQKQKLASLKESRQKLRAEKKKAAEAEKIRTNTLRADERQKQKREYLQEVKEIIGPDNYVLFLENMVINGGGRGHKMKSHAAEFRKSDKVTQGYKDIKSGHHRHHASREKRNKAA